MAGRGVVLADERVELRPFNRDDWSAVHEYASRMDTCRFEQWGPNSVAETQRFVAEAVASTLREPREHFAFAVVLRDSDRLVGGCHLGIVHHRHRCGEIGYVIHPDYWRQGYATATAALLLRLGFTELHLHRIQATCDPRNVASARVLQKSGLRHEGRLRDHMLLRDGWRDSDLYSILEQEWPARGSGS